MINEIDAIFDILQCLDIKPTQNNVQILNATFNSLRKIHNELEEKENAGAENGKTSDICGRDNG